MDKSLTEAGEDLDCLPLLGPICPTCKVVPETSCEIDAYGFEVKRTKCRKCGLEEIALPTFNLVVVIK